MDAEFKTTIILNTSYSPNNKKENLRKISKINIVKWMELENFKA